MKIKKPVLFLNYFLMVFCFCNSVFSIENIEPNFCASYLLAESEVINPNGKLSHEYIIIPSGVGRDNDLVSRYRAFVEVFSKAGGVLDQLGIPRTKQIVEFAKGIDMLALTSTSAALPVPHYLDGAQILNAINRPGMIYEVVYPGPNFQHGYYRDDNPFEEQLSILMHVIGHNHFAVASHFPHYRVSNPTESAADLAEVLHEAYSLAPKEDVENYYLFIQTLTSLADFYSAYYQAPEDFSMDSNLYRANDGDTQELQKRKALLARGIKSSTENVMAAFTQRVLQSNFASPWEKKVIELLPKLAPYRPALVHTQVMNEGWASIMQEIVMDHMGPEYNTLNHWFAAQHVTRSEDRLNIKDPYWLGVRVWRRLKQRFEERPEILALSRKIEKDRAFIRYAEEEIISKLDDFQFLQMGLDDYMIQGLELAITRKATPEEARLLPPPPQGLPNPEPHIVVTRDPQRVRQSIIDESVGVKMKFNPRVVLKSFNRQNSGEVELIVEDDFGKQIPVEQKSIGAALYSLSNIVQQPISFEATFRVNKFDPVNILEDEEDEEMFFGPSFQREVLLRARVVIDSSGKLEVHLVSNVSLDNQSVGADEQKTLFENIEQNFFNYLRQLHLEDDAKLEEFAKENPRFDRVALYSVNQMINNLPLTSLIEHVPSAADAINEYQAKVGNRLIKSLGLAMNGNGGLKRTSRGLFVQALVGPVNISFESKYINTLASEAKPGPVDWYMTPQSNPFDHSDVGGTVRGPLDKAPGRGGWLPGPSGGQGKGSEPGDEKLDPSWVPLPEELYAQFLNERVKLPNLKPKTGMVKSQKTKLLGYQNQRHGQLVVDRTAMNALRKGLGGQLSLGNDAVDSDVLDTLELGFSLMRPQDFVVRKPKAIQKPDTNAVIVFARDASGSTAPYTDIYKRFVFDMKTLISSNYKNVKFEYIIFDTDAHVMETENDFFRTELGGGTSYKAGVEKVLELMAEKYPESKFDRFPFIIGDLGDFYDASTAEVYERMIAESSYSGTVKAGYGVDEFTRSMERMSDDNEFYGFIDIGDDPKGYTLQHLRVLLKNKD